MWSIRSHKGYERVRDDPDDLSSSSSSSSYVPPTSLKFNNNDEFDDYEDVNAYHDHGRKAEFLRRICVYFISLLVTFSVVTAYQWRTMIEPNKPRSSPEGSVEDAEVTLLPTVQPTVLLTGLMTTWAPMAAPSESSWTQLKPVNKSSEETETESSTANQVVTATTYKVHNGTEITKDEYESGSEEESIFLDDNSNNTASYYYDDSERISTVISDSSIPSTEAPSSLTRPTREPSMAPAEMEKLYSNSRFHLPSPPKLPPPFEIGDVKPFPLKPSENGKRTVIFAMYHKTGNVMFENTWRNTLKHHGFSGSTANQCKRKLCTPKFFQRHAWANISAPRAAEHDTHVIKATGPRFLSLGGLELSSKFLPDGEVRVIHLVRPVHEHVLSYFRYHITDPSPEPQFASHGNPCFNDNHNNTYDWFDIIGIPRETVNMLLTQCRKLWTRSFQPMFLKRSPHKGPLLATLLYMKRHNQEEDMIKILFYHTIFYAAPSVMHGYRNEILLMVVNSFLLRHQSAQSNRFLSMQTPLASLMDSKTSKTLNKVENYANFMLSNRDEARARAIAKDFVEREQEIIRKSGHITQGSSTEVHEQSKRLEQVLLADEFIGPLINYFNDILGF